MKPARWLPALCTALATLLPATPAAADEAPVHEAAGVVRAHTACAYAIHYAPVSVLLKPAGENRWTVGLHGYSSSICPMGDAATCDGAGDLFTYGIQIQNCLPLGGSGWVGPFRRVAPPIVCVPESCPDLWQGPLRFSNALGSFVGVLTLAEPA